MPGEITSSNFKLGNFLPSLVALHGSGSGSELPCFLSWVSSSLDVSACLSFSVAIFCNGSGPERPLNTLGIVSSYSSNGLPSLAALGVSGSGSDRPISYDKQMVHGLRNDGRFGESREALLPCLTLCPPSLAALRSSGSGSELINTNSWISSWLSLAPHQAMLTSIVQHHWAVAAGRSYSATPRGQIKDQASAVSFLP